MSVRVVEPGLLTTVQDLGRRGYERHGVPGGGAMDAFALRAANLLVGNGEGDAGLEITLGGPTLRFDREALVAIGGAELRAVADGVEIPAWHAARLPAGATLSFRGPGSGCRAYLAVAGGIAVAPVLGSRSTFLRAGIGGLEGRALRRGDVLPLGEAPALSRRIAAAVAPPGPGVAVAHSGVGVALRPEYSDRPTVGLMAGAHADALFPGSRVRLFGAGLRVSPDSDRMGYRLEGAVLELRTALELLSEPVAFGTVQLPPDGRPIVLMADRQTTGGYPRIGEVATVDLPLLAQLKPGDSLRFRPCSVDEAQARLLARERGIARLRQAISLQHP